MGERFKRLRQELGLTLAEMAAKIGVTPAAISKIERGDRVPSDQFIISICNAYHANEEWLRNGLGEVFEPTDGSLLDELAQQHDLDAVDKAIIAEFIDLPHEYRVIAKKIILGMADRIRGANAPLRMTEADLDEIIARGIPDEDAK